MARITSESKLAHLSIGRASALGDLVWRDRDVRAQAKTPKGLRIPRINRIPLIAQ
jgi:hypothetical protein